MTDEEYIGRARSEDPSGTECGECGLTNYFADDCGWFYGACKRGYMPLCENCFSKFGYKTCER